MRKVLFWSALCVLNQWCMVKMMYGQAGCTSGSCVNPVGVVDISNRSPVNTWSDGYATFFITSDGSGNVTGSRSWTPPPPGGSCAAITWNVNGSISPSYPVDGTEGSGALNLSATNPTPPDACNDYTPVDVTYSMTIQNDGNDVGTGTYSQSGGGGSVLFTKSSPDIPDSEQTTGVGFGAGPYQTIAQFRQILNLDCCDPNHDLFKGRQVSESTGFGDNHDSCYFDGSIVPKRVGVEGSSWNVGYYDVNPPNITSLNTWGDDYIGWNTYQVDYYRQNLPPDRIPCDYEHTQVMSVAWNGSTTVLTTTYSSSRLRKNGSLTYSWSVLVVFGS
jgi:hypothetical protein